MDDVPAFTKTTGLMELNDKANKVKLCHSPNRGVPRKSSYANYLCPVISVKAGKKPKCKINSTNKKSAGNDGVVVLDSAGVYPREGGDGNDGV
jgi:hypothetical protein